MCSESVCSGFWSSGYVRQIGSATFVQSDGDAERPQHSVLLEAGFDHTHLHADYRMIAAIVAILFRSANSSGDYSIAVVTSHGYWLQLFDFLVFPRTYS